MAYALSIGYNTPISLDGDAGLTETLKIQAVPPAIYKRGFLKRESATTIITNYKVEEVQCYFRNNEWLKDSEHIHNKVIYLYALSQRSIGNKSLFIPKTYLDSTYWSNPFLKIRNDKLWFNPEITKIYKSNKEK